MIVTVVASGESNKAIVISESPAMVAWLVEAIVQPLAAVKRDYAGTVEVYEGDITHKCSEEDWCEPDCYLIGSVDYNKGLKAVKL